jgi:iron complex outermembrane receptor protein
MNSNRMVLIVLLLLVVPCFTLAQGTITGKVVDNETQQPLAGANVIVQGTTLGTSTNSEGRFSIANVPIGEQVVVVSYIGYTTQRKTAQVVEGKTVEADFALVSNPLPGQTVVVTATRARERETPVTFSNLEARDLEERYTTQDIPLLLAELPSTTYYSENGNGIGYNYVNIRGFDQRRLAVMVNGIPQNDPEDHNVYWLDFPDLAANLEDIQVQRGAGSAFYGPPAIGGTVNMITSTFSRGRKISLLAGAGSFNTQKYSVAVSSGVLAERYAFYGRLSKIKSDGYRDRSWTEFNSYFLGAVRYDENMTTQLNFYGGPVSDHLAYYGIPKSDITDKDKRKENPIARPEEIENFSQPHYELLHEWRLSDNVILNNTFFLVTGAGFFDYDGSWGDSSYFRLTFKNGFRPTTNPQNALIRAFVNNTQYGWLPRLAYNHGSGTLTVGAEARLHRSLHWGRIEWAQMLPDGATPDFHYYEYRGAKDMLSLYAQELYRLRPDMTVMVNLQYAFNRYRLYDEKYVGTDFTVPYHFFNPRIGFNYNITNEWNVYVSLSRTSREPRLKNLYDAAESSGGDSPQFAIKPNGTYDFDNPLVKNETLNNVELGVGYGNHSYRVTANFYWMDFSNEIVKSGQVDRFGQPITGNADKTRHQGVELSGLVRFLDGFELIANATLSQNRLINYRVYQKEKNPTTGIKEVVARKLDDNRIAGFPDFLANARLSYRRDGFLTSLSARFVGDQMTDNFGDLLFRPVQDNKVDAYFAMDFTAAYRLAHIFDSVGLELKLQVNNLLNRLYAAHGEGEEFFPAAERSFFFTVGLDI